MCRCGVWSTASAEFACITGIPSVAMCNATGSNASRINGVFEPPGAHAGKVLFRKKGDLAACLWWEPSGQVWMVGPSTGVPIGQRGWSHCLEPGLDDPREARTWSVLDGSFCRVQGVVICVTAYNPVVFGGATGPGADIVNGVFEPAGASGGRQLFRKRGNTNLWLRWLSTLGKWMVSVTFNVNRRDDMGCCSNNKGQADGFEDPRQVAVWQVWDDVTKLWVIQLDIKCVDDFGPVVISNATGETAGRMSGCYDAVGIYCGKLLFQKRGDHDTWLRWVSSLMKWMASATAKKDARDEGGTCCSVNQEYEADL